MPAHLTRASLAASLMLGLLLTATAILYYSYNVYDYQRYFLLGVCTAPVLMLHVLQLRRVRITVTDLLAALYLIYLALNWAFVADPPAGPLYAAELFVLASVYLCARLTGQKGLTAILCFLTLSGVLQAAFGIAQYVGWAPSYHPYYEITGSFPNPGPFGGYLAVCISLSSACLWRKAGSRCRSKTRWCVAVSAAIMFIALIFSGSRAAFLSLLVAVMFLAVCNIRRLKMRVIAVSAGILLIAASTMALYKYRKDSADGRLFIWKVSARMISDSPLLGSGVQSFPAKYILYQGRYFEDDPAAPEAAYAGNNYYAFNEFIRIGAEQGVAGLALALSILLSMPIRAQGKGRLWAAGLVSLLVFSCFSYPGNIMPLKMLFPLLAGIMAGGGTLYERELSAVSRRVLFVIPAILLLSAVAFFTIKAAEYKKAYGALEEFYEKPADGDPVRDFYDAMKNDRFYVRRYAEILYDSECYVRCLPVLERAALLSPSSPLYCELGDVYKGLDMFGDAESAYLRARFMTPGYVAPLYGLFRLYVDTGDGAKAAGMAERITATEFKVVNSVVLRARAEAKRYLRGEGD